MLFHGNIQKSLTHFRVTSRINCVSEVLGSTSRINCLCHRCLPTLLALTVSICVTGGPLGELVQWSDLITTLFLLGHDLTITSEVEQLVG